MVLAVLVGDSDAHVVMSSFTDRVHGRADSLGIVLWIKPQFCRDPSIGEFAGWVIAQNPLDVFRGELRLGFGSRIRFFHGLCPLGFRSICVSTGNP